MSIDYHLIGSTLEYAVFNACHCVHSVSVHFAAFNFVTVEIFLRIFQMKRKTNKSKSHLNYSKIYCINGKGLDGAAKASSSGCTALCLITNSWCVNNKHVQQCNTHTHRGSVVSVCKATCCWKPIPFIAHDNSNNMRLLFCIYSHICFVPGTGGREGERRDFRSPPPPRIHNTVWANSNEENGRIFGPSCWAHIEIVQRTWSYRRLIA